MRADVSLFVLCGCNKIPESGDLIKRSLFMLIVSEVTKLKSTGPAMALLPVKTTWCIESWQRLSVQKEVPGSFSNNPLFEVLLQSLRPHSQLWDPPHFLTVPTSTQ